MIQSGRSFRTSDGHMPRLPFHVPHYPLNKQWQNVALLRNLYHNNETPPIEVERLAFQYNSILKSAHEEMENTCAMIEQEAMQKIRAYCTAHIHRTNAELDGLTMQMRTILADKISQYEQHERERLTLETLARQREASLGASQGPGYGRTHT